MVGLHLRPTQLYDYNNVFNKKKYAAGLLYDYDIMFKVNNSQQELLSCCLMDNVGFLECK